MACGVMTSTNAKSTMEAVRQILSWNATIRLDLAAVDRVRMVRIYRTSCKNLHIFTSQDIFLFSERVKSTILCKIRYNLLTRDIIIKLFYFLAVYYVNIFIFK